MKKSENTNINENNNIEQGVIIPVATATPPQPTPQINNKCYKHSGCYFTYILKTIIQVILIVI